MLKNIFDIRSTPQSEEQIETILEKTGVKLERLESFGHATPEGFWYDQSQTEWVMLVRGSATLLYDDGHSIEMHDGDHIIIPSHAKHRVESVSQDAIWLALFY